MTSLLGVWLCNEGGHGRAAVFLFWCSFFFLEWKGGPVKDWILAPHLLHEKTPCIMKESQGVGHLSRGR